MPISMANGQEFVRRLQQTGGATLIVSLPKEWIDQTGLKKFDEILLVSSDDGTLHIIPRNMNNKTQQEEFIVNVMPNENAEGVLRDYISAYLAGYNTIRIRFNEPSPGLAQKIRQLVRRWLIGVEVVEETIHEMVTQCLPTHNSLPLMKALERMGSIASSMQREAVSALAEQNKSIALEVVQRDDEVDRFYHFIVRQLNIAVSNPVILKSLGLNNRQDCLGYMLVTKSIERAADHASSIANLSMTLHSSKSSILEKIVEAGYRANKLFDNALKSILQTDRESAKQTIQQAEEVTKITHELNNQLVRKSTASTALRLLLENIKRIAEYSSDISEVAVNLSVKKPRINLM